MWHLLAPGCCWGLLGACPRLAPGLACCFRSGGGCCGAARAGCGGGTLSLSACPMVAGAAALPSGASAGLAASAGRAVGAECACSCTRLGAAAALSTHSALRCGPGALGVHRPQRSSAWRRQA